MEFSFGLTITKEFLISSEIVTRQTFVLRLIDNDFVALT